MLDVGGESTRPGRRARSRRRDEIARVAPALEALAKRFDVAALDRHAEGARWPKRRSTPGAHDRERRLGPRATIRRSRSSSRDAAPALVLGHLRGEPATMQQQIVFARRRRGGRGRALAASVVRAGRRASRASGIAVDPGIGFGKRLPAQPRAPRAGRGAPRAARPSGPGRPVAQVASSASSPAIPPSERDAATHAACAVAIFAGADAVRVHDVAGRAPRRPRVALGASGGRAA